PHLGGVGCRGAVDVHQLRALQRPSARQLRVDRLPAGGCDWLPPLWSHPGSLLGADRDPARRKPSHRFLRSRWRSGGKRRSDRAVAFRFVLRRLAGAGYRRGVARSTEERATEPSVAVAIATRSTFSPLR